MDASKRFLVYGLFDTGQPDVVRYVGQTHDIRQRMQMHRSDKFGPLGAWKRGLSFFGRSFDWVELESFVGTRQDSKTTERFFIDLLDEPCRLLNSECYWKRCGRSGVSRPAAEAYIDMTTMLFELVKLPDMPTHLLRRFAHDIDLFESRSPEMIIYRYSRDWINGFVHDSFTDRIDELRELELVEAA